MGHGLNDILIPVIPIDLFYYNGYILVVPLNDTVSVFSNKCIETALQKYHHGDIDYWW